ncbi:MAG: hypothetical protein ACK5B9_15015 [Flavobacteriia bacterium]|jgi:AcrR family transcriptional regulator
MTKDKIIKAYIEFELLNGRKVNSVLELCKKIKLEEKEFYKHFKSLDALAKTIPLQLLLTTKERLLADENFETYSGREKILALFFTLFEEFLNQRSYFVYKYSDSKNVLSQSKDWSTFLSELDCFTQEILQEARINQEIQERSLIDAHSHKAYKLIFTYLFRVWLNDESDEFSITDAAIEKSVNLSFDMLEKSPLDSLIDFGKFALKTKIF